MRVFNQIRCAVDILPNNGPPSSSFTLRNKHGLTKRSGNYEAKPEGFIQYSADINTDFCMAVMGLLFRPLEFDMRLERYLGMIEK